jgi:hypothetical protein
MDTVHVFVSTGRFRSLAEMRAFVEETCTEDGDGILSAFGREVAQSWYEPGCIECLHRAMPISVLELLAGASYSDQWLPGFKTSERANAAICVFKPNVIEHPEGSSLKYLGAFPYKPEEEILNDAEPSLDTVRRWAFDERLWLMEQDEDMILADVKYVPLLLELAADPDCPKARYCLSIVEQHCRFILEWRHRHLAEPIAEIAEKALSSPSVRVREWAVSFRQGVAAMK